jgi:diacylglycerol kinase (ATP)
MRNKPKKSGLTHVRRATVFSLKGFRAAWQNEFAFRLELGLAALFIPLALLLGDSALERGVLIGCVFLVLICEIVNSAIEAVVDRIGIENHALSGQAKDLGSAAVFLALCNFTLVWGLIGLEKLPIWH